MLNTTSIKENKKFVYLYKRARYVIDNVVVIYYKKNKFDENYLGITVNKKIGCAVIRNRVRRLIKEVYRKNEIYFKRGYDIVIVARANTRNATYFEIENSLKRLMKKAELMV